MEKPSPGRLRHSKRMDLKELWTGGQAALGQGKESVGLDIDEGEEAEDEGMRKVRAKT